MLWVHAMAWTTYYCLSTHGIMSLKGSHVNFNNLIYLIYCNLHDVSYSYLLGLPSCPKIAHRNAIRPVLSRTRFFSQFSQILECTGGFPYWSLLPLADNRWAFADSWALYYTYVPFAPISKCPLVSTTKSFVSVILVSLHYISSISAEVSRLLLAAKKQERWKAICLKWQPWCIYYEVFNDRR